MRTKEDILTGQTKHLLLYRLLYGLFDLHVYTNQAADQQYRLFLAGIGQESIIANFHESGRQNMEQEAANKFHGVQCHSFNMIIIGPVHVGEGHFVVVDGFDTVVGDCDSVRVAAQVGQNLFRSGERLFGIYDPIFAPGCFLPEPEHLFCFCSMPAVETERFSSVVSILERSTFPARIASDKSFVPVRHPP